MAGSRVPNKDEDSVLDIRNKITRIKKSLKQAKTKIEEELEKLRPWVKLIRPNIGILSSFGVLVGAIVSSNLVLPLALYALLAAFLIASAGIVINDYFDLASDLVNQPQRPLPAGDVSETSALGLWGIFTALGLALASLVSPTFLTIAAVNAAVAFLYSWHLQNKAVIGNLADSFLAAITFLAGGLITSGFAELELSLTILAMIAFLGNLSREIFKDVEDIRGDKRKRVETLPLIIGRRKSTYLAKIVLILAISLATTPYLLGFFGQIYLLLVSPVMLVSIYPVVISYRHPRKSQKVLKISMFGFMVAFLLAAVV